MARTSQSAGKNVIRGAGKFVTKGKHVFAASLRKKKHRFRPGTVALRQIRHYQKSTDRIFRFMPFRRLIQTLAHKIGTSDVRLNKEAVLAIQEAVEAKVVRHLEDANLSAIHAGRVTVMGKDVDLAIRIHAKAV